MIKLLILLTALDALIPSNLFKLEDLLVEIKDDWCKVGTALGVLPTQHGSMSSGSDMELHGLKSVLSSWLNHCGVYLAPVSWEMLVLALVLSGHQSLANRIRRDYGVTGEDINKRNYDEDHYC